MLVCVCNVISSSVNITSSLYVTVVIPINLVKSKVSDQFTCGYNIPSVCIIKKEANNSETMDKT